MTIGRRYHIESAKQVVGLRQTSVCRSIIRILLDRSLEVIAAFEKVLVRQPADMVSPQQVKPVHLGVYGRRIDACRWRKPQPQPLRDCVGNVSLEPADVRHLPGELLAPNY